MAFLHSIFLMTALLMYDFLERDLIKQFIKVNSKVASFETIRTNITYIYKHIGR